MISQDRSPGDVVDLSMVIPAGQDSHSFEPTPADIRLTQNADLLICNGGTMEQWVTQVLGSLDAPDLKVITMMDYVDVVQEEIVEGMEDSGDDHGHDHAHHDEEDGDHADHDHDTEDMTMRTTTMPTRSSMTSISGRLR